MVNREYVIKGLVELDRKMIGSDKTHQLLHDAVALLETAYVAPAEAEERVEDVVR